MSDDPFGARPRGNALAQIREMVRLLAAPAAEQGAWLTRNRYPTDELALQFLDAIPSWLMRLEEEGLFDETARARLLELHRMLDTKLIDAKRVMWQSEPNDDQDWSALRRAARNALQAL